MNESMYMNLIALLRVNIKLNMQILELVKGENDISEWRENIGNVDKCCLEILEAFNKEGE